VVKTLDTDDYIRLVLDTKRPGAENVFAFYEHRLGAVCKDPRLMLVPLDDHLVHRGDGVFETLKYLARRIYQLDAHLERMARSSAGIFLEPPMSWDKIRDVVLDVARAGGSDDGLLSLYIGRGPGGFTTDVRECPQSSFYIVARRFTPVSEEKYNKGATAMRTTIPAKQSFIARIKCTNYLPNVLMKREAVLSGNDYPFAFNDQGYLSESATENICLVDRAGVLTVPDTHNSLVGTTMTRALELIRDEVPVEYRRVTEDDVYNSREVIILGTTMDAIGVVRFNDRAIGDGRPGPVAARLRELIKKDISENGVLF